MIVSSSASFASSCCCITGELNGASNADEHSDMPCHDMAKKDSSKFKELADMGELIDLSDSHSQCDECACEHCSQSVFMKKDSVNFTKIFKIEMDFENKEFSSTSMQSILHPPINS